MPTYQELTVELARERARLTSLEAAKEEVRGRLRELESILGTQFPPESAAPSTGLPKAEKLRLFRDLFSGRPDVFAARWTNERTGRTGWAPRCANE